MAKTKYSPHQPTPVGWWIAFIFIVLLFVVLFVILLTQPYPVTGYYRSKNLHGKSKPRTNCTIGEVFDKDLLLCAPVMNTPIPISHKLMDYSVNQCDSFFNHMSGRWIQSHKNENRGFNYIYKKNQKQIHDIVRNPKNGPIYKFYRSCVDTLVHKQHKLLDQSQFKHVKEHILGAFKTRADLPVVFARLASYGFTNPLSISIESHPTKLKMIPLIRRDFFDKTDLFLEIGYPLTMIYDFEECIKKLEYWHSKDDMFQGDFVEYVQSSQYTKDMMHMGALLDVSPPNFWKLYLREMNGFAMEEDIDMANQNVWVMDSRYIKHLMHGMNDISMKEWTAYIHYSILYSSNQFLPRLPSDSYFRVHNPLKGEGKYKMLRDDSSGYTEESCITITHKLLPGIIGNAYLEVNMENHDSIRAKVTQIVENVRDSFADMIYNTTWMSETVKKEAIDKIHSIIVRTVHPNYFETEPYAARLTEDSYLRNLNIIRRYIATKNFELWTNGTPNRDFIQRFGASLTEVNAFYSPVSNTITIFSGILNEPFYSEDFPDVAMYAIIGMVAGHELGHALDNTGRLFNKDGSLSRKEPWSFLDLTEFEKRTDCMVKEFDAPFGCENADYGRQTLGEDMSDLSGLTAAYQSFLKSGERTKKEKIWFFQIFAQAWAESWDQKELCDRVKNDEHAVANFRVDKTLRQMVEFRELFNCKKGDNMVNDEPCIIYGK